MDIHNDKKMMQELDLLRNENEIDYFNIKKLISFVYLYANAKPYTDHACPLLQQELSEYPCTVFPPIGSPVL